MTSHTQSTIEHQRSTLHTLSSRLVDRESLLQLIVLSIIAREHLLILGPPGTAKSAAVRAIASAVDGRYFEYLLGRFTEPSELFGPIDLKKLKEGVVQTEVSGMLPQADIAFLDEVFLGSTAILNTLLGILNERKFKRGHTDMACPLKVCVAASNTLPQEPALMAFADRFLVRVHVEHLPDSELKKLLSAGWKAQASQHADTQRIALSDLDALSQQALQVDMAKVRPALAHCVRLLRKAGIELSDRRVVKTQSLIAASAVLNNTSIATEADLWPLVYTVPTPQAQQQAREVLQEILQKSQNQVLPQAVSTASCGPLARAGQIKANAELLLGTPPEAGNAMALEGWQLKCEALLKEMDACFSPESMSDFLAPLKQQLAAHVAQASSQATH